MIFYMFYCNIMDTSVPLYYIGEGSLLGDDKEYELIMQKLINLTPTDFKPVPEHGTEY